jgi:hypothetical protein
MVTKSLEEAAAWLDEKARERYPRSSYAIRRAWDEAGRPQPRPDLGAQEYTATPDEIERAGAADGGCRRSIASGWRTCRPT